MGGSIYWLIFLVRGGVERKRGMVKKASPFLLP